MVDIQHTRILTNGVHLHVAQAGPPEGKLVILLHGFPEFWYGWRHQMEGLAAAGYRVWVPDQRGYNTSDKPEGLEAYQRDTLAADVLGLIEAAGVERCVLVGHDWGGVVAWWVAAKYPEKLEKLIVINCPHHRVFGRVLRKSWRQKRKSWYMLFFQLPRLPEMLLRFNHSMFVARSMRRSSNPGTFSEEVMQHYREAWAQPGAMTAMINWYRAAYRIRSERPKSPEVQVPTLLIWGRRDAFLNAELAQPSIALCQQGRLVMVEDATHWIASEKPEDVNKLMLEFLAQEGVNEQGVSYKDRNYT